MKKYSKVIVQRAGGNPVSNAKVALSISGILSGGVTPNVYTNRQGVAIIEHESSGNAKVMVNGTIKGTMKVPGETVIFI